MSRPVLPGALRVASSFAAVLVLAGPVARAATVVAPPVLPAPDAWLPGGGGSLRLLDKQKASSQLVVLKTGQSVTFETLTVTLDACYSRAPSAPPNGAAHLTVRDAREGEPGFNGWMLADEPWVATLQSPVYGVRVVGCDPPTPEAVAAATPVAPPVPTAVPPAPPGTATASSGGATPAAASVGSSTAMPAPPAASELVAPPGATLDGDNDGGGGAPPPDAPPPSAQPAPPDQPPP